MGKKTELLNNVYRKDIFLNKLKDIYNKTKNQRDKKIVDIERDIFLLKIKMKFTKIPDILLNQLTEITFSCKECFKVFIHIYKITLKADEFGFKCKKEYLRKIVKLHRNVLDRAINELEEKNMVLIEKEDSLFTFIPNLSFLNWNISDSEKMNIRENIENELEWYNTKFDIEEINKLTTGEVN